MHLSPHLFHVLEHTDNYATSLEQSLSPYLLCIPLTRTATTCDQVRTLNIVCGNYWRQWRRVPGSSLEVFVPARSHGGLPEAAEKYPHSAAEGPTNRKANRRLRWRRQEGPAQHTRDEASMENENVWGVHSEEQHLCFFPLCFSFSTHLCYLIDTWR